MLVYRLWGIESKVKTNGYSLWGIDCGVKSVVYRLWLIL